MGEWQQWFLNLLFLFIDKFDQSSRGSGWLAINGLLLICEKSTEGTTAIVLIVKGSHLWIEGPYKQCKDYIACWIWPGYPTLNWEYKTMVKMGVFAQIFVKQWSWVLKQDD